MKEYMRLKEIRLERKETIKIIAKLLGATSGQVSAWERGKHKMPTRHYIKLAKYYNLSLDYIAGLIDEPLELKKD